MAIIRPNIQARRSRALAEVPCFRGKAHPPRRLALADSPDVPITFSPMPIRLGDLADDEASLELRCRQCGRTVQLPGKLLVQCYGVNMPLTALLARMRCEHDGMVPDARIVLISTLASREALRRGISIHEPRW